MKKTLLAGAAALSVLSASAAHAVTLPDTMTGEWCYLKGEANQSIYIRAPSGGCEDDSMISIGQEGSKGLSSCAFEKIEQEKTNVFLIYSRCVDNTGGPNTGGPSTFEIIDGKLVINEIPEG
jgi:hypothetical protein